MKQSLSQKQKLSLKITASLGSQIKLLSLSGFEISSKLNEIVEDYLADEDKTANYFRDEFLIDRYKNILHSTPTNDLQEFFEIKDSELKEKLFDQLAVEPLNQVENLIGEFLIDSIEDNGRLDPELDYQDIKRIVLEDFGENVDDQEIDSVLSIIQNFDPPGCAFRSINESLIVQINNLNIDGEEKDYLKASLSDLINNKIKKEDLSESLKNSLKKLSLNLGSSSGQSSKNYVRPDVIAKKEKGLWHVSLNDEFISKKLLDKIKNKIELSEDDESINSKSFLIGLERRQQTLIIVSKFLVEVQTDFLNEKGKKRAISNKEIADQLDISPSTVSRIVRNKYIQLPSKVIPLKNLLEKRLNTFKEGNDVTSSDLKFLIKEMISHEDKSIPISDEGLKALLQSELGILISRRTVAKYRKELNVPSSRSRAKD